MTLQVKRLRDKLKTKGENALGAAEVKIFCQRQSGTREFCHSGGSSKGGCPDKLDLLFQGKKSRK